MSLQKHGRLKRFAWHDEDATQLAEFAIALPLLIFFVVGIFDFSGAFTLKQKLTNIARDTARAAAADPSTDLSSTSPYSVNDAFYIFDNYLLANNINDCGISQQLPTVLSTQALTWQSTVSSSSSPPCGITFTINRGYYFPLSAPTQPSATCTPSSTVTGTQVVGTCVSIQYSYQWRFGQVASLLGTNAVLPTSISAVAVAMNEN